MDFIHLAQVPYKMYIKYVNNFQFIIAMIIKLSQSESTSCGLGLLGDTNGVITMGGYITVTWCTPATAGDDGHLMSPTISLSTTQKNILQV